MEAVRSCGLALQYVKERTSGLCFEAVKEEGLALEYVENQTEELMLISLFDDYRFYEPYELERFDEQFEDQMGETKLIHELLKHWDYHLPSHQTIRSKLALNEINQEQSPYHVLDQLYMMG